MKTKDQLLLDLAGMELHTIRKFGAAQFHEDGWSVVELGEEVSLESLRYHSSRRIAVVVCADSKLQPDSVVDALRQIIRATSGSAEDTRDDTVF
jgi:hypothetical protein